MASHLRLGRRGCGGRSGINGDKAKESNDCEHKAQNDHAGHDIHLPVQLSGRELMNYLGNQDLTSD